MPINANDLALHERLEVLCEDIFVRDGKLFRHHSSHGHGSDTEEALNVSEDDPQYEVQVAAWRMIQTLYRKCKNGKPHRMREFPATLRCVDCHFEERAPEGKPLRGVQLGFVLAALRSIPNHDQISVKLEGFHRRLTLAQFIGMLEKG